LEFYQNYLIKIIEYNRKGKQMNKLKKLIAIILCFIMVMGSFAFAEEIQVISADVKDYEGHWAQPTIQNG